MTTIESQACINHPDRPATHVCTKCAANICFDCMEIAKGRRYCNPCAVEIDAEYERALAAQSPLEKRRNDRRGPTGVIPSLAYGLVAAVISALIWDKLAYFLNVQIGVFNLVFGVAIGISVLFGSNRGGLLPGLIGMISGVVSVVLGHVWLCYDYIGASAADHHVPRWPLTLQLFINAMALYKPLHWVFVAVWLIVCIILPWKFYDIVIPPQPKNASENSN